MCSLCEEGSVLERIGSYAASIQEKLGFGIDQVDEADVNKDLAGFDYNKAKQRIKKKDEL